MATGEESKISLVATDKRSPHALTLLLRVTQRDDKPLLVGSLTNRKMYEQVLRLTGLEPLSVTIMNEVDVMIEFEESVPLEQVAKRLHCEIDWDDSQVRMTGLLATKEVLREIVRQREETRVKQQEIEKEQKRLKVEQAKHEQQLANIIQKVEGQVERKTSIPTISGDYETPHVSETRMFQSRIQKPPKLPMFSGQIPVPVNEGSLDQWLFQVEGALETHTEEAVRSAIIGSVRGPVRQLLEVNSYREELPMMIRRIKERFGMGISKVKLQKEFFLLEQKKGETIGQFAGRLEHKFKFLKELYPDRYDRSQLKERVFQGMNSQLRDSMRFLYTRDDVGYEDFLTAVQEAEAETVENRNVQVRSKAASVEEVPEIKTLKAEIESLTAILKNNGPSVSKEKNVSKKQKGSSSKSNPKQERKQQSEGSRDSKDHVLQCWKCGGFGHYKKICPTRGNVNWRELKGTPSNQKLSPEAEGSSSNRTN